jgi:hypothetical protein
MNYTLVHAADVERSYKPYPWMLQRLVAHVDTGNRLEVEERRGEERTGEWSRLWPCSARELPSPASEE